MSPSSHALPDRVERSPMFSVPLEIDGNLGIESPCVERFVEMSREARTSARVADVTRNYMFRSRVMMRKTGLIGLATAGALAGSAMPALAQVAERSQDVHVYVGKAFGDDVTDMRVAGRAPEVDDDVTFGLRYGYHFTADWGLELSLGRTNTSVTSLPGRDLDLDLTTFDVDAIRHFNSSASLVPYVFAGVGYVSADLDRPITGTVAGIGPVRINDDNGFTLNAGAGAKWYLTDVVSLRLDLRYRYLDKVVDRLDDSLNTFETTVGVGLQF